MMQESSKRRDPSPLRAERIQRHWSQREVAERVGATVATVKRWERQATVPGPYFRLKLTALFGKSEEALGLREALVSPMPSSASDASSEEPTQTVPTPISSIWVVPYLRNPYFTGRDELFDLLDKHLPTEKQDEGSKMHRVALTQTQALTGLGGIGKTQLAVEYAYRMYEQGVYIHTFWINAASEEAILTSFTTFATLLPAFSASNETDQQKLVNTIKQWLEEYAQRWLLIFDNADDLSLLQNYFPRHGNGSILLTTRAHAVGSLAVSIDVEKMGFLEATQLLLRRAQRVRPLSDEEIDAARQLVRALDHFPLALEQAGAYIEETGCTFAHYLHLYHTHRSTLLARRGAQATNYPDSVATTWALSFEKIQHANPAAAHLLQVCAFLAPDHIPEELLREGAVYWPPLLQQAVSDPLAFDQALEALQRFSLVKRLAEDQQVSIHRLVQVVQIERIAPQEQHVWAERIVRAVNALFPHQPQEDVSSWPQCLRYLEQVEACVTLIQRHGVRLAEAADLLERAGTCLRFHVSYPLAEAFYQQALHLREELLGHHPETAKTLNDLGILYRKQGKYEQAEPYFQQALHLREELLGHHPDIAKTLNDLGLVYWKQGKYEQAESYFQQALHLREELLGTHHPDIAATLNNLGILYHEQGKYEQAESYLQRALTIYEKQLGAHHPDTAITLNNLAAWYRDQHEYEQARPLFVRALEIQEHTLTVNHSELARTLHGFARFHEALGTLPTAVALYQRALSIREQTYGPQHSKTRETCERLQMVLHLLEKEGQQKEPSLFSGEVKQSVSY